MVNPNFVSGNPSLSMGHTTKHVVDFFESFFLQHTYGYAGSISN